MPTRQEIAARATRASARAARERRFNSTVVEMCDHPEDVGSVAAMTLAEVLRRRGWTVTAPVGARP